MTPGVALAAGSSPAFADVMAFTTSAGIVVCGILGVLARADTPRTLLDNIAVDVGVGTFAGALSGVIFYGVSTVVGG